MGPTLFDPIRKKDVAATPEEGVRQAVLRYLLDTVRAPANLIGVEFSLSSLEPGNFRRADIVVWKPGRTSLEPWLLVECKAPGTPITEEIALQVGYYLQKMPCPYLMLSNGKDTFYLERNGREYRRIAALPHFQGG